MPPQTGEAADGRTDYNSGFKSKARAMRASGDGQPHAVPSRTPQGFCLRSAHLKPARAESEPGKHRGWRAHADVVDGVAGQEHVPLQQGAHPPRAPLRQRVTHCPLRRRQLLGTGSHAVSSVLSMAKKYPRVLVLYEDKLLCCKLDEMEVCTYKWLKKARGPLPYAATARDACAAGKAALTPCRNAADHHHQHPPHGALSVCAGQHDGGVRDV